MNERTGNSQVMDLERSLRALADDDRHVQAPPHVEAAVMQAWDAMAPFAWHRRQRRSGRAALLAIGSTAAAVVAALVLYRAPSAPSSPEPVIARTAEKVEQPPAVTNAMPADRDAPGEAHRRQPRRSPTRGNAAALPQSPGMVLVADPIPDASITSIVRVRVPRAALATLGLPLVDPDDRGSVDLEMLVGEDGVARTIRRAMPVVVRQE